MVSYVVTTTISDTIVFISSDYSIISFVNIHFIVYFMIVYYTITYTIDYMHAARCLSEHETEHEQVCAATMSQLAKATSTLQTTFAQPRKFSRTQWANVIIEFCRLHSNRLLYMFVFTVHVCT